MLKVAFLIPSSGTAARGEAFNVLAGVENDGPRTECEIRLWGRAGGNWRPVASQRAVIEPGEHRHLYFTIPPEAFEPEFWNGEEVEELELIAGEQRPADGAHGTLVFVGA